MISDHQQEQASLYALGVLSDSERLTFEAEVALDPEHRSLLVVGVLIGGALSP